MKRIIFLAMIFSVFLLGCDNAFSQRSQPYQTPATYKAVTTAWDTVALQGSSTAVKYGIVTNQGDTTLQIAFCLRGTSTIDTNTYFYLAAGKTLKFATYGTKLLRKALSGTVLSQVYEGAVELNYNDSFDKFENFAAVLRFIYPKFI